MEWLKQTESMTFVWLSCCQEKWGAFLLLAGLCYHHRARGHSHLLALEIYLIEVSSDWLFTFPATVYKSFKISSQSFAACVHAKLLPSFHHYSAHSYFHLNILTSLFSSYHLSSSLNWLACPLYSELIQGRQGFRSHGIPGGASLQISRGKFSRLRNSPVLLGQAPSVKKS